MVNPALILALIQARKEKQQAVTINIFIDGKKVEKEVIKSEPPKKPKELSTK